MVVAVAVAAAELNDLKIHNKKKDRSSKYK